MEWLNLYGIIIIALILVPNILFAVKCSDGFENRWKNRTAEILEQAGRYACMGFMIFNIPGTYCGFWFAGGLAAYLIVNGILIAAYCIIWAVCFRKNNVFRALFLSILPSLIFLFSGVSLGSFLLIAAAVLFAPCHILISYKNAVFLADKPH